MERKSGILMPIASLPGEFGIGTLGKEAYKFADFLKKAGQKYWQMLPIGPTSYGDSPYQSFSAFAGNPYFIDFDLLEEEGLLKKYDYANVNFGTNPEDIDYGLLFIEKMKILKIAYERFKLNKPDDLKKFEEEESFWLDDYSLYMAIKSQFELKSWQTWDMDIKLRKKEVLEEYKIKLQDEIEYWKFIQYKFFEQWNNLKNYVNDLDIDIIGDIPIYVAEDSADIWANPKAFLLDQETLVPLKVSGCPPDHFAKTGQLWGNPIYDWEYIDNTNYKWWIYRMRQSARLYDVTRIDHFRGFESYWSVPYGDLTAENGEWVKGPGMKLFNAIKKELGDIRIIAEDLGFLTDEVVKFREDSGFPGMKILQFAFTSDSSNQDLPHNYEEKYVAYTGTHDNNTFRGWFEKTGSKREIKNAIKYLGLNRKEGYNWGFIRGVWSSKAYLAVGLMQDFLNLGNEARINVPSTLGTNWRWRFKNDVFTDKLANKIYNITKMYGRCD
ncbi:4-alpha-glucanotransferase [Clostridium weizhouense]|uniref:4-alpha-glucanotransferase n=1 Tax=Clostridium weizhouense TaxID=2859781 RepID=A0ABS7AMU3_9CLOT|nr:4-alpha-glucanotransferase [Clostridium weizhouense]MBW6409989.1 4-alpha-glucanotransferase [Clostridium weizhouense]